MRSFALATLCAASITVAAAGQSAQRQPGDGVLRAMHDAYAGKWFHTLTFVQKTTVTRPGSEPTVATWYESMLSPDRLRIDIGAPKEGNGVLYTTDSLYVIRNGAVAQRRARGNPLLPFVGGIYTQPIDSTLRQIQAMNVDLSRTREATWEGRAVTVVGASDSTDLTSPQFWVDHANLMTLRVIAGFGGPSAPPDDVHFDDYVQVGDSWLATKCIILQNGAPIQTEEYTDWRGDRVLPLEFFVAEHWADVPHWAGSGH